MSGRSGKKRQHDQTSALQPRLPFANVEGDDAINSDTSGSIRGRPVLRIARSQSSNTASNYLSSSYGQRIPTRSYYHHASGGSLGTLTPPVPCEADFLTST